MADDEAGGGAAEGPAEGDGLRARHSYRLVRRLGKTQRGATFLASCVDSNPDDPDSPPEEVAVKLIRMPDQDASRRLLRRELAALLALRHDRIPRVYDQCRSRKARLSL